MLTLVHTITHAKNKTPKAKHNAATTQKIPKTIWNMVFVFGQHVLECCCSGLCEKDIASVLPRPLCHAMPWLRFAVNFHPSKMRLPCGPKNRAHIVHEIPANKNEGRQSAFTFCGLLSATEIGRETCAAFCCAAHEKNKFCSSKKTCPYVRACVATAFLIMFQHTANAACAPSSASTCEFAARVRTRPLHGDRPTRAPEQSAPTSKNRTE